MSVLSRSVNRITLPGHLQYVTYYGTYLWDLPTRSGIASVGDTLGAPVPAISGVSVQHRIGPRPASVAELGVGKARRQGQLGESILSTSCKWADPWEWWM